MLSSVAGAFARCREALYFSGFYTGPLRGAKASRRLA
jgi:hypothetical protein